MATKRKRNPTEMVNTDERIPLSGFSMRDLPITIFVDILLKLPTKSILVCKSVCKTWHSIISDPQFAKLHLAQSNTSLLIRTMYPLRFSRALYLLEPEDGRGWEYWCCCQCGSVGNKCDRCSLNIKAKPKLKIPLRNAEEMFDQVDDDTSVTFYTSGNRKKAHFFRLESRVYDHKFEIVNSCDGLLCLTEPWARTLVVVCNLVTGEFIELPESCNVRTNVIYAEVGLGFCPKNSQYKVIRIFSKDALMGYHKRGSLGMVEIHTLGTDSWRSVDILEFHVESLYCQTYANGAFHWLLPEDKKDYSCIVSFDLAEEKFHFYSVPSPCKEGRHLKMGVLDDCLCLYGDIGIRVMKEYGDWESWIKLFSRSLWRSKPMVYLNNGALLMVDESNNNLIYFDQLGGQRFKYLKFRGTRSKFEAIAHAPSFLSLKDIVKMGNAEVFNVKSSCGKLKLAEEDCPLFLESSGSRSFC